MGQLGPRSRGQSLLFLLSRVVWGLLIQLARVVHCLVSWWFGDSCLALSHGRSCSFIDLADAPQLREDLGSLGSDGFSLRCAEWASRGGLRIDLLAVY